MLFPGQLITYLVGSVMYQGTQENTCDCSIFFFLAVFVEAGMWYKLPGFKGNRPIAAEGWNL